MSKKPNCSDGRVHPQETAGASVVCAINSAGALILWDPQSKMLRVVRGFHLSPLLRSRIAFNFEAIVAFLVAQAQESAS